MTGMVSTHWLRYGQHRTGFEVRLLKRASIGLRWSGCVFNAPAGPWLHVYKSGLRLDAWSFGRAR